MGKKIMDRSAAKRRGIIGRRVSVVGERGEGVVVDAMANNYLIAFEGRGKMVATRARVRFLRGNYEESK